MWTRLVKQESNLNQECRFLPKVDFNFGLGYNLQSKGDCLDDLA